MNVELGGGLLNSRFCGFAFWLLFGAVFRFFDFVVLCGFAVFPALLAIDFRFFEKKYWVYGFDTVFYAVFGFDEN